MADPFPIPHNPDITYIAQTDYRDQNRVFGVKRKDRRQHMYVLGKSGTGKSALLSNMIYQNILHGEGVCLIDPHGELAESILEVIPENRIDDVIYFNPADTEFNVGFNVLEVPDPKYKHLIASGLMGVFTKIWANAWSSRMEYILNNAILALLDTPGSTLLGIPRLLVDKGFRQDILANVNDPVVKAFWINEYEAWQDKFRNEAIQPVQNKVGQFLSTPIIRNIVGQAKSTINIFDIMNQGKILIVNVSKGRVGEDNSALLGAMIVTKLQLAAMERVRIPEEERRDFYLYVDEFQNFVNESFASILSEARKYRLNLTVAHQYTAQLETAESTTVRDAVFGNVGTMIIFRVGAADAEFLEKEFQPEFVAEDFVNLPNYHVYLKLLVDGMSTRPFSARTLPPIYSRQPIETIQRIIDTSRSLYTRPRPLVEEDITKWASGRAPGGGLTGAGGGIEGSGDYEGVCAVCGKNVKVPFEPKPGLPIYCKEDLAKVKAGEIPPARAVPIRSAENAERSGTRRRASQALGLLGIEFAAGPAPVKEKEGTSMRPTQSGEPRPIRTDRTDRPERRMPPNGMSDERRRENPMRRLPVRENPNDVLVSMPIPVVESEPVDVDPSTPVSFAYDDILSAAGVHKPEQKPETPKADALPEKTEAQNDRYVPTQRTNQNMKIVRDAKTDTREKLRSALSALGVVNTDNAKTQQTSSPVVEQNTSPIVTSQNSIAHVASQVQPQQPVTMQTPISTPVSEPAVVETVASEPLMSEVPKVISEPQVSKQAFDLEQAKREELEKILAQTREREHDLNNQISIMRQTLSEMQSTIAQVQNRQEELEKSRRMIEDEKSAMSHMMESERSAFLERIGSLEADNKALLSDIETKTKNLEDEKRAIEARAHAEAQTRQLLESKIAALEGQTSQLLAAEEARKKAEDEERARREVPEDTLKTLLS